MVADLVDLHKVCRTMGGPRATRLEITRAARGGEPESGGKTLNWDA